jgi:hypothetical protein
MRMAASMARDPLLATSALLTLLIACWLRLLPYRDLAKVARQPVEYHRLVDAL